jgi:hypothetical protein
MAAAVGLLKPFSNPHGDSGILSNILMRLGRAVSDVLSSLASIFKPRCFYDK